MKNRIDQFSALDPNPALRVREDGTILYSNKAGELLLNEWGVRVKDKIPSSIGDILKTVISFNSPKKMELNVGKRVYLTVLHPLQEEKCICISGFDISKQDECEGKTQENEPQKMVEAELSEVIDIRAIQLLINEFYKFTHIPIGLADSKDNVILGIRWQDICARFHRIHPETYKHCVEKGKKITFSSVQGKPILDKCKNNLWDIATPIIVGNRQIGTIFLGQFFFEDEPLDYELFRSQARKYGFDEKEYIASLEKVPRLSREAVETGATLVNTLANLISQLSCSNTRLAQSLSERDSLVDALQESEKQERARSAELAAVLDAIPAAVMIAHDPLALKMTGNRLSYEWIQLPDGTNISKAVPEGKRRETHKLFRNGVEIPIADMPVRLASSGKDIHDYEFDIVYPDGMMRHVLGNFRSIRDEQGNPQGAVAAILDITKRKQVEEALNEAYMKLQLQSEELQAINEELQAQTEELQAAYQALSKSEESYRMLFANMTEAFFLAEIIFNEDGNAFDFRFLEINPAFELHTGIKKDNILSKSFREIFSSVGSRDLKHFFEITLFGKSANFDIFIPELGKYFEVYAFRPEKGKIAATFKDITDRKQIEEALHKSEEKYRNIVETSNECIIITDKKANITYTNKRLEEVFGYGFEETIGKPIWGFISEESMSIFEKLPENGWQGINESFEVKLIGKDGSFLWSLINVKSLIDNSGQFMGVLGMLTDITKRKNMEDALRENEEKYRNIVETANEGISLNDGKGLLTYVNQKMAEMLGYDINEIIGRNILDFVMDIDDSVVTNSIQRQLLDNIQSYDFKLLRKDHSPLWVFVNIKSFFDEDGQFIGSLNMFTDITERKNADMKLKDTLDNLENLVRERTLEIEKAYKSLKESEQILTEAQKIAHIGNWTWDIANDNTYFSEEIYRIFGLSPQSSTPNYKELFEYIHPEDRDYVLNIVAKNEKHISFDFRIILANGEERTVNMKIEIVFDDGDIPIKTKGTIQDITERKQAEEKKKLLASIVESSSDAIGTLSLNGTITSWNKGAEQVYGYSQEEVLGKSVSIVAPFYLEKETINLIEKARQGEKIRNFETSRIRKDGKTIHVSLTLSPLFDISGKLSAISVISTDITERKLAEEKLRESEEKYRNIVETANEGIVVTDKESRISYVNKKMADMLGYTIEEIIGRSVWDFIDEESKCIVQKKLKNGISDFDDSYEIKLLHKNGSLIWTNINAKVLFDENDEVIGFLAMLSNITERKKTEEELWKSENRFRVMFEEHGAPMLLIEPKSGKVIDANKAAVLFYEYSREQLQAMFIDQINQLPPKLVASERYNAVERNKNVFVFTHRLASGDERLVEVYSSPVTIQGQTMLFSIIHDITKRKKAEEALRDSEEKYRSIVETASEGILITNKDSIITYLNKKMADMLGYTVEESIGKPIWYFHTEETKNIVKSNLIKRQQGIDNLYEAQLVHKDGSLIWVTINAKCLIDKNGEFMGSLGMLSDITKRKEAEQVLANLDIARKQEIHHRIKNNLQVISSLLDLQSEKFRDKEKIKDSEVLEAFKKSQDRVISMALIHEELHKGEGLDELNFSSYVEELTDNLFLTNRPESIEVCLNMDLEENIVFDMDIAVPLGIIVNELVSNSLKYAFPGGDNGEIKIILHREERDLISIGEKSECDSPESTNFILSVSDNGVGIPEYIDIENPDSLGLQLVMSLVDQLDGILELKRINGTEFIIRFAVKEMYNKGSAPVSNNFRYSPKFLQ